MEAELGPGQRTVGEDERRSVRRIEQGREERARHPWPSSRARWARARPSSVPDRQAVSTRELPQPSPASAMPSDPEVERRLPGLDRCGVPPAMRSRPLRDGPDAQQIPQGVDNGPDDLPGARVVPAGEIARRVRDEDGGAVAAPVTVVGDEGEHRVVIDERGGNGRPLTARPAGCHGDHRPPLAALQQGHGGGVVAEQAARLRVGHGENDGVGGLAIDCRARPGPTVDGEAADAVVLAMPPPQAHRLLRDDASAVPLLEGREWRSVISVAAGWPRREWPAIPAAFVNDHPVLALVADDGDRRGDGAPVLVAHTTSDLARRYDARPGTVGRGPLSTPCGICWASGPSRNGRRAHRWRYAAPVEAREAPLASGPTASRWPVTAGAARVSIGPGGPARCSAAPSPTAPEKRAKGDGPTLPGPAAILRTERRSSSPTVR